MAYFIMFNVIEQSVDNVFASSEKYIIKSSVDEKHQCIREVLISNELWHLEVGTKTGT